MCEKMQQKLQEATFDFSPISFSRCGMIQTDGLPGWPMKMIPGMNKDRRRHAQAGRKPLKRIESHDRPRWTS